MIIQLREAIRSSAADGYAVLQCAYRPFDELKPRPTSKNSVALTFLYSSLELGRSSLLMIQNDIDNSLLAAAIIMRSQLDHQLRGMFFGLCASDEQFEFYRRHDKMPRGADGTVTLNQMAKLAVAKLDQSATSATAFTGFISDRWDELTSFAHGGHAMLDFYRTDDEIRPLPPHAGLLSNISATVVLSVFAMSAWSRICELSQDPPVVQHAAEQVRIYLDVWEPVARSLEAQELSEK